MATELRTCSRTLMLAGLSIMLALSTACEYLPKKTAMPVGLVAPYGQDQEVIWAVAPLRNESGTSAANELGIADTLRNQLTEVHGISALPVNRTINAMRALNLASVDTPGDAQRLAAALGVDAIVVGSITSWQPYHPPQIGLNLVLFANGGAMGLAERATIDPVGFSIATTERTVTSSDEPVSAVSVQLDGASNEVRCQVDRYAEGRHDPSSAMGPERYLKSMSEFEKFACFRATELLLEREYQRLAGGTQEQALAP